MNNPSIAVIIASTRPHRIGPLIGQWVVDTLVGLHALDVSLVDLADYKLPVLDEPEPARSRTYIHDHTKAWSRTIDAADGFIMVLPEHNWGMPASVKNALDFLYWEWQHKPIGFVSYSGGVSGGVRAVEMTKQVAVALEMRVVDQAVNLPKVESLIVEGSFHPLAGAVQTLHELASGLEQKVSAGAILETA